MRIPILFVTALVLMTSTLGQTAGKSESPGFSEQEALSLMRLIITSEIEVSAMTKSFVSLDKLLEHRNLKSFQADLKAADGTSGNIKGYRLSVVAAADGKQFQVSLIPEQSCQIALFGSQSGVIYKGKSLGCTTP